MDNQHHTPLLPGLEQVFRIKRTEVWDLARDALYQASPDGTSTNYAHAMALLLHAAGFIGELAMVNARNLDELDLVGNCVDLSKIEANRLLDFLSAAVEEKRVLLAD